MVNGNFGWHELYARDVEAAKAFYAATVGSTFEGMPMPHQNRTYWVAQCGRQAGRRRPRHAWNRSGN
jgi:predicted enzyme related to lactoylglutathione lyase